MAVTYAAVASVCVYVVCLFIRGRFVYLHSLFLIPLFPLIFFIDHNAHFVNYRFASDTVHYLVKLAPLYLTTILLLGVYRPRRYAGKVPLSVFTGNLFFLYMLGLALVYSVTHKSWLPLFYVSYSLPLFALFFNARNLAEEIAVIRNDPGPDRFALLVYFLIFIGVYVAGLYYSLSSGLTTSFLDSRGVGSVFASTSVLVYCVLFAPLLTSITKNVVPHVITIAVGIIALSKTALLLLPGYALMLIGPGEKRFRRALAVFFVGAVIVVATSWIWMPTGLIELWKIKFALENDQTFLQKAYLTRLSIFSDALNAIQNAPLGIGIGNFERYSTQGYRDPHNFVLNVAVESGVLWGAVAAIVLVVVFLQNVRLAARGRVTYVEFTLITVCLIYATAAGILLTSGSSLGSPIYYTPFYGVAIMALLNIAGTEAA